ncbi:MAG: homocysteine S-methyltransferase family protein [Pseudomonadota bacterium]
MTDIVLLDGGMGQELVRRSKKPAHKQWGAYVMMQEPEIVQEVHEEYLRAGARVITLNTYSSTPGRFERFGMPERFEEVQHLGIDLAKAARDAVGAEALIAGCMPPLVGSYHPELLPDDATLLEEYRKIAQVEADHVDVFICETMSKASEGQMAALAAAETGKPVWVAWTLVEELGPDGLPRLRSGETVAEALAAIDGIDVAAVMFNCCPPEVMTAGMGLLAADGRPFGGYANGFTPIPKEFVLGTTVDILGKRTDLGPEAYAGHVMEWVGTGATIVGGCCETGPEHIAELARQIDAAGHRAVAA